MKKINKTQLKEKKNQEIVKFSEQNICIKEKNIYLCSAFENKRSKT